MNLSEIALCTCLSTLGASYAMHISGNVRSTLRYLDQILKKLHFTGREQQSMKEKSRRTHVAIRRQTICNRLLPPLHTNVHPGLRVRCSVYLAHISICLLKSCKAMMSEKQKWDIICLQGFSKLCPFKVCTLTFAVINSNSCECIP